MFPYVVVVLVFTGWHDPLLTNVLKILFVISAPSGIDYLNSIPLCLSPKFINSLVRYSLLFPELAMVFCDLLWSKAQRDVRCEINTVVSFLPIKERGFLFTFTFDLQVIVSGKLRAQRAKSMKFKDGYMISSGQPVKEYIDSAVRHVLLRQVSMDLISQLFGSFGNGIRGCDCCTLCFPPIETWFAYYFDVAGCSWNQSEDHARLGSKGQDRPHDSSP